MRSAEPGRGPSDVDSLWSHGLTHVHAAYLMRTRQSTIPKTQYPQPIICPVTQRVLSTNIVECRVSTLGITNMIWGSIPHNST